jgi:hypothetical protein
MPSFYITDMALSILSEEVVGYYSISEDVV